MLNTQFFRGDIVVFEDDTAECPTEYMVMELFTPCDLTEEEKQDPTSLTVVTELQSILSDEDGLFDYDECGELAIKKIGHCSESSEFETRYKQYIIDKKVF